jgi:tellurite resistance protein
MGITGLGLVLREGVYTAPAWLSEPIVFTGMAMGLVLLAGYARKLVQARAAVREEFLQPSVLGFCATLPIALVLMAGGAALYTHAVADVLWWTGVWLLAAFQAWALSRWLRGGIDLAQVNGGWMVMLVGSIVVPATGLPLGHESMSAFAFGVGAAAAPLVTALVLHRCVVGPALAEPMRPTLYILLVPPSLIYANGIALLGAPPGPFLTALYYFALVLAAALLVISRGFRYWPYSPAAWAFTFPLDALAYAASRHAQLHPLPVWRGLALVTLALAFTAVLMVAMRAVTHALRRTPLVSAIPE